MTDDAANLEMDHELAVDGLVGTALRGAVAVLTGSEESVSPILADVAVALVDSTEVARLDAMKSHTAAAIIRALVVPLGTEPDHLIQALRARADTLPLVLVVENAECLGNKALAALRALMEKSRGGLGLVIGGDEEVIGLLQQAGLEIGSHQDAAGLAGASRHGAPTGQEEAASWHRMLPWKHLAAVAGLLLLVMLFWPGGEPQAPEETRRVLTLPEAPSTETQAPGEARDEVPAPDTEVAQGEAPAPVPEAPETEVSPPDEPPPRPAPAGDTVAAKPEQAPATTASDGPAQQDDQGLAVSGKPELTGLDAELGYRAEDWLLTRPGEQWMLQLTLAADEDRARAVLDQLGRNRGAYYRARRDAASVYIVLAGPYGSREEALGARAGLPDTFRDAGPFPRPLTDVQKEISAGTAD